MSSVTRRAAWLEVLGFAILLFPLAGALLVSFVVTPEDIESGRFVLSPTCAWRALIDAECPTCGLTRAFAALSHGRFSDAFAYHGLAPAIYAGWWVLTVFGARGLARAMLGVAGARELRT